MRIARPIQRLGGIPNLELGRLWTALRSMQLISSPGVRVKRTTQGTALEVLPQPRQTRAIATQVILMQAPFMDPSLPAADYNFIACAFSPDTLDLAQLFTDYQTAWQAMRDAFIAGDAAEISEAQSAFAASFLLVEVPQHLSNTPPWCYYGHPTISGTTYRLSMNTRAVEINQGVTQPTSAGQALEQVIDPPYWVDPAQMTPTFLWVTDPEGTFQRGWGRTWLEFGCGRNWMNRALAENNLKAKNGSTLYPVGGHDTPATRWPD